MTSVTSKYEQLAIQIEEEILSGRLASGAPLPSIRQLVASKKLSWGTVVKSIDLLEQRGLIDRHPQRGCFVADRMQYSSASGLIAFVTPALGHETNETSHGIASVLPRNEGLTLSVFSSYSDLSEYVALIERVLAMRPKGLILEVLPDSLVEIDYQSIERSGVPTVIIGSTVKGSGVFDGVNTAHLHKAQIAIEHMIDCGSSNIGLMFMRANTTPGFNGEISALKQVMQNKGLPLSEDNLLVWDGSDGYVGSHDPILAAKKWVDCHFDTFDKFDGVICDHDYPAVGLIRSLQKKNVCVPRDINVLSLGRNLSDYDLGMTLTTVDNQRKQMGAMAWNVLQHRIEEKESKISCHYWPGKLIAGDTTRLTSLSKELGNEV